MHMHIKSLIKILNRMIFALLLEVRYDLLGWNWQRPMDLGRPEFLDINAKRHNDPNAHESHQNPLPDEHVVVNLNMPSIKCHWNEAV